MARKKKKHLFGNATSLALGLLLIPAISQNVLAEETDDILDMSIEDLKDIEVKSSSTLTETTQRLQPAAVTIITAEQIQASGARNLYELLDIYVPNLQWLRHHWEQDNLGLRGILSDRDDKYMLLVNGHVMNERTHFGVYTEKDLPYLSDIYRIEIVRGPGSALYGPGAIAMVISITTFSGETFQGTDVTTRIGAVEEFYTSELRFGRKFAENNSSVFLYGAIGEYIGADGYDAPMYSGFTYPTYEQDPEGNTAEFPADGTAAGERLIPSLLPDDGGTHRNLPPVKLYGEYRIDDLKFWTRYTRGGQEITVHPVQYLARQPWGGANGGPYPGNSFYSNGYQQITSNAEHKLEIDDDTYLTTTGGYTLTDFEQYSPSTGDPIRNAYREDKYNAKMVLNHNFNEDHKVAVGTEVLHNELGLDSLGWPDREDPINNRFAYSGLKMPRWSTNLYSVMGEYQMNITDQLTAFAGARLDDHTYTDLMFSPRAALVYAANEKDTWKLLWSRSVRSNFEDEMKAQAMKYGQETSDPEKLDTLELRYERAENENFDYAASAFVHYNLEVTGWNSALGGTVPIGTQRDYGLEVESSYHNDRTRLTLSHGYTKLYDFNLSPDLPANSFSMLTVMPNGYGNDFARWSNNITKLTGELKLNDAWSVDSSFRAYWGFPGMKDYVTYMHDVRYAEYPRSDDGWERAFRGNYYLDMGLQYKPTEKVLLRLDGYNLLGLFNLDMNKRNYNDADFRCHAVAVAATLRYAF